MNVIDLLIRCGAHEVPHPGGTLLDHLRRVHALLQRWEARPAVRLAGLCHAFYGTDGFPTALGEVTRRDVLAAVIGNEAERLVYLYGSCDRAATYPQLTASPAPFTDRFTGAVTYPPTQLLRDFAEITVANELDVMSVNAELRSRHGESLRVLFVQWRRLLSSPAWQAVQTSLG